MAPKGRHLGLLRCILVAMLSWHATTALVFPYKPLMRSSPPYNLRSPALSLSKATTSSYHSTLHGPRIPGRPSVSPSPTTFRSRLLHAATVTAESKPPPNLKPYIEKLLDGDHLTTDEAREVCAGVLGGSEPIQVASALMLMRRNGETPEEVAGFVAAMKEACVPVKIDGNMLDIVGTGGDGAHTINISTAAAILAAAAGCKTAKAGNRSVSSQCGSADVLEALGISMALTAEQVGECVARCGMGFMFAPVNHPAMKMVAPIRKALGVRSVFNILGPLTNAAGAQRVVIGVFTNDLIDVMGKALMEVGNIEHGVVIHGAGLDEISPLGSSTILEIKNIAAKGSPKKQYQTKKFYFDPLEVGTPRCTLEDLRGGDAKENAALMREALQGGDHTDAKRDAIVLNAGVGIYVFGLSESLEDGILLARKTLNTGKGLEKLDEWIQLTQELAPAEGEKRK